MKSLFLILGNQLFPHKHLRKYKDSTFFMCESFDLCTFQKHHKLKLILFLSSMRSYADELKKNKFKVNYIDLKKDFKISYEKKLENFIKKNKHIMIQKFLPEIIKGDRRIFIIGGKVKGAISRVPRKGSILSNMSKGAKAKMIKLNKREIKISSLIAKKLIKNNIILAGVDFIGGLLIGDINITSPTGLKTYKDLSGRDLSKDFWNYVENKYAAN